MDSERRFYLAFNRIPYLGPAGFRRLESAFGSLAEAWRAPLSRLRSAGLGARALSALEALRPRIDPAREEALAERLGLQVLTWRDPDYPARLREIPDPPPVLYLKGNLRPEDARAVAVVGTRRPTPYGRQATAHLVEGLARAGVTVVSGLALGIDGVAHRTALEAGGRTLAVLACGLDRVYPPEHRDLAEAVARSGALLSEFPPGTRPEAHNFPRRNRLLSGLALGVLVVEAPEASGALITVRWALDQGREVMAVPGPIFSPASRGALRLLQEGARLVMEVEDILEEVGLAPGAPVQAPLPGLDAPEDEAERALLEALASGPLHIDDLVRQTNLPVAQVTATLTLLEVRGRVRSLGGMHFARAG